MLEYILDGGLIMLPLVLLSVMAAAIIIDRCRAFATAMADTEAVRRKLAKALGNSDLEAAIKACEEATGPLAAVALTGLDKYRELLLKGRSPVEMETVVSKVMEDYAPHALASLERRFNLLVMIATIAPLLGMTGTVTGMIKSFDRMAETAGLDPGAVAGGISEALITTAAGLLIAVPAYVAYNIFARKVEDYVLVIEQTVRDLVSHISNEG